MGNTQSSPATCSPAWFRSVNPPNHAPLRDSLVSSDQRPMDAMMSPRESLVLPSSDGVVDGRRSLSSFRFRSVLGFSQPGSWFRRSYSSQRVDPVPDVDPAPQESHIHTKMPNTSSPAYAGNASSAIDDESNNLAPTKIEVTSDAEDSTVTLADSAETNTASPYSETTPTPQNAPSGSDTDTSPPIVPENGELPNSVPTFDEAEEEPFEDPVEHHAEEHLIPGADHTITEPSHSAIVEETADIAIDAVDENHLTSSGLMAEGPSTEDGNYVNGTDLAEPSQLPRASGSAPEVGDQPDDEEDSLNFMSDDEDSTVRGLEESENGSQSQTTSSSNPTQQSNGDQPRSVLPEEVLGNIVRFAMMSALRRSLMNSQRPGPTDSSLETEPTASNPLPQNRLNTDTFFGSRPPPLMVIGIPSSDSETDRNSSDTTSEEQDATASGTQNDGNQPNLTSRGSVGSTPSNNNRRGWYLYIIAEQAPPQNANSSSNTDTATSAPGTDLNATSLASQLPQENPESANLSFRPNLEPPVSPLQPGPDPTAGSTEGDQPEVTATSASTEDETTEESNVDGTSDGSQANNGRRNNDAFLSFLVNMISRIVREDGGGVGPRVPNTGTGDYEDLLRLAELIGPARPRNASREDVLQQLPVVRWYPMDYDAVDLAKVSPLHGQTEIALVSTDDTTSASLEIDDPVPLQDTEEGATVDPGIEDGFGTLPTAAELSRPEDPVPTSTPEASAHVLGVPDLLAATREKCTICLAPYEEDDELRILRCKHGFHSECIDQWLTSHVNNCPMCRQPGVTTTINPTPPPSQNRPPFSLPPMNGPPTGFVLNIAFGVRRDPNNSNNNTT